MTSLRALDRWMIVAVIAGLIFGVDAGLKAGDSSRNGTSSPDPYTEAVQLLNAVDNAQLCQRKRTGQYTDNLANLEETMYRLDRNRYGEHLNSNASIYRLKLVLTTSADGSSYSQRISGKDVDVKRARRGAEFGWAGSSPPPPRSNVCRPTGPKRDLAG